MLKVLLNNDIKHNIFNITKIKNIERPASKSQ